MNRKTRNQIFIGVVFIGALTGATPDIAFAVPKGGGKCACMCTAPNGAGGTLAQSQTYSSQGISCAAFENHTCNMTNPVTGGVATGRTLGCATTSSSSATIIVPWGDVQVVRSGAL